MIGSRAIVRCILLLSMPSAACAADVLKVDMEDPALTAQRTRQAALRLADFEARDGGAPTLRVPVLELPTQAWVGFHARDAAAAPTRTFTSDDRDGHWYTVTDDLGDFTISVSADIALIATPVSGLPTTDEAIQVTTAVPEPAAADDESGRTEDMASARVVFRRYGVPYVVDIECSQASDICQDEDALRSLVASLELTWAPEK